MRGSVCDYNCYMQTLLFDIDGTLVKTNGAGKAAMESALRTAFGITEIRDVVPYSGRTDPAIGHDLLQAHGVDATQENYLKLSEAYLDLLPHCLNTYQGEALPGVTRLLKQLAANKRHKLGLLTGNARVGAQHKLIHFGLWDYFPFGGFGDDHRDRDDVARAALAAAGPGVEPNTVWVIGDTPLDVKCARAIGAKVVAVATGWHPYEELMETGADSVLHTLEDFDALPASWFAK